MKTNRANSAARTHEYDALIKPIWPERRSKTFRGNFGSRLLISVLDYKKSKVTGKSKHRSVFWV